MKTVKKIINAALDIIIVFLLIINILNLTGVITIGIVNGESMLNTFHDGDFVIAVKQSSYKNNDIVFAENTDKTYEVIKRVIATPGQTIQIINGQVYIDDVLLKEDYLSSNKDITINKIILGKNQYYIMGDNRNNSYDSRNYGPVTIDKILGKVNYPRLKHLGFLLHR